MLSMEDGRVMFTIGNIKFPLTAPLSEWDKGEDVVDYPTLAWVESSGEAISNKL